MLYALFVHGSPFQSKACHSALTFAKAIIKSQEHQLKGVFFYQDAVLIGNGFSQNPRDEFDLQNAWQTLSKEHNIELSLCIAAAVRRGIISEQESQRYELKSANLAAEFKLEGLGTLVSLMNDCDKVISFK
ncbi:sulfurtransferase TusD [Marinomonas sp. 42_23_T18]|nr:sulfurtransferase TusD [Marinomonas sp. 42_23_T18]